MYHADASFLYPFLFPQWMKATRNDFLLSFPFFSFFWAVVVLLDLYSNEDQRTLFFLHLGGIIFTLKEKFVFRRTSHKLRTLPFFLSLSFTCCFKSLWVKMKVFSFSFFFFYIFFLLALCYDDNVGGWMRCFYTHSFFFVLLFVGWKFFFPFNFFVSLPRGIMLMLFLQCTA